MSSERFFKYHGLGNDFIVLDRRTSGIDIDARFTQALCDRRLGIGADGVLTVMPSKQASARMVVHNADGSVPEMCGNGLRCVVKYLVDMGKETSMPVRVETGAGVLNCSTESGPDGVERVEINMGAARLVAHNLPSGLGGAPYLSVPVPHYESILGSAISMGNPHWVLRDAPLEKAAEWGPILERSPLFPEKTNVEFVQPTKAGLKVVVWERGVGITRACGTGACASVVAAIDWGMASADVWVPVELPGGTLDIRVSSNNSEVLLRGPVAYVFDGYFSSELVRSGRAHED